jgi:hypothetical protein
MTTKVKSSVIDTVANTQITGLITAGQIASIANTQITGLILPEQIAGSGSGVTSVSVTSPVTNSGSGTAPNIGMPAASAGQNGYMSSTYASKLDGIAPGATNITNNNQLTNGAGYVTSASIPSYTSQLTNNSGFITSSSLSGYATTGQLSSYLPLSGGTLSNNLIINNGGACGILFGPSTAGVGYDGAGGSVLGWIGSGNKWTITQFGGITSNTDSVGKPSGGQFYATSDIRLKENIVNYTKGLDDINTLRTVNFNFIGKLGEQTNKKTVTGLIAQDVLKTPFANMVGTGDDGMYNIDPSELMYALVNAVQQLSAEVESLKAKLPK